MAIYAIMGASASGKTTIERLLEKMGNKRIVSYTTRPARVGEINGVDYHFVSDEEFSFMKLKGYFQETARYRDWNYGLSLYGVNYKEQDYIAVVTVHGYEELLRNVGEHFITGINIKVDERERMFRLLKRGDAIGEVVRRLNTDREDFKDVENIADYVIGNHAIEETLVEVFNIINSKSANINTLKGGI